MKKTKKIAALLFAFVMVFCFTATAFAADTGSITINNPVDNEVYNVYKMFDLRSYDAAKNDYSYRVTADWVEFVSTGAGKDYFETDTNNYVYVKEGVAIADNSEAAANLAKAAIAYAKAKSIAPTATLNKANNYKAEGLDLGYYVVDSSLGTLCALTTTNNDATVNEKNDQPTIDKQVQENSNNEWGKENDASIGDTVNFKTTIYAKANSKNYVLHDKMSAGLDFNEDSVVIKVNDVVIGAENYEVVTEDLTDDCTFEIKFTQAYLDTLTEDTTIVVEYSAVINKNAVIYTDANTNDTYLSYGDASKTETSHTDTYIYKFDLVKTNNDNEVLDGAEFKLYDAETGGNEIALVMESEGVYRVATAEEKNVEGFTSATIVAGVVTIKGLDSGTYWLEETKAPEGFNPMSDRQKVEIDHGNLDATLENENATYVSGGVQVINRTGSLLPSTGGIGTTIFYIVGGLLVVAAAILLITKRRMKANG